MKRVSLKLQTSQSCKPPLLVCHVMKFEYGAILGARAHVMYVNKMGGACRGRGSYGRVGDRDEAEGLVRSCMSADEFDYLLCRVLMEALSVKRRYVRPFGSQGSGAHPLEEH